MSSKKIWLPKKVSTKSEEKNLLVWCRWIHKKKYFCPSCSKIFFPMNPPAPDKKIFFFTFCRNLFWQPYFFRAHHYLKMEIGLHMVWKQKSRRIVFRSKFLALLTAKEMI